MITDNSFDVLCLTETWLKPNDYIGLIPPFHQQEPGASSEPVLLPVLSWFDWRAL